MKLTKARLTGKVKNELEKLGYTHFMDTSTGAQGLFAKELQNGFYLTLGLTISRLYEDSFTGSFYLSKTTRWSTTYGDIPLNSYRRIGCFLTSTERAELLKPEFRGGMIVDAWWETGNDKSVKDFLTTIEVTEKRFLSQEGLFHEVENSECINELANYATAMIAIIDKLNVKDFIFQYLPLNPGDEIPFVYYAAAEIVLKEKNGFLNAKTVKLLAADAWRKKQLANVKFQSKAETKSI